MDRILNDIHQLWWDLAVKRKEFKDQKAWDEIINKLSEYAFTLPCLPKSESLTQYLRSLEEEDKKIKAMLKRGRLARGARNSIDAKELVSSCDTIKNALDSFLVSCS